MRSLPSRSRRASASPQSSPFRVGARIRAMGNYQHHSYSPGQTYVVCEVDADDSTLKARDSAGESLNWIKWDDCALAADIGWEWLKAHLPSDALDLLGAFEGVEHLRLKEDIRNHLVKEIPDLRERILTVIEEEDSLAPVLP